MTSGIKLLVIDLLPSGAHTSAVVFIGPTFFSSAVSLRYSRANKKKKWVWN